MAARILATIFRFGIAAWMAEGGAVADESVDDPPAPVFVLMVSHFDFPGLVQPDDLEAFRQLSVRHPLMKWTHLYTASAYTDPPPLLDEIEDYLFEARDGWGAEIGLHLHMFRHFVEAAGVTYRDRPTVTGSPPDCYFYTPSGYIIPLTVYDEREIRALLELALQLFVTHGFDEPRAFCAGFYTTSLASQTVLTELGFTSSLAAFPGGTVYGDDYGACWELYSGWGAGAVSHTTPPYLVSTATIQPGGPPPYLWSVTGALVELPQLCKIDSMISADEMEQVFALNHALAAGGEPRVICLAVHDHNAAEYFEAFDQVLTFIDTYVDQPGDVPVIYATASVAREALLPVLVLPGDLDFDRDVDLSDLAALLAGYQACAGDDGYNPVGDLDHDGCISLADLAGLLAHYGDEL